MKDDFSVLIQNRTEFEKGNPATVFLSLPATKEELLEAMKALNITAENPQDFFLNGYSTADNRRIEIPFDWIRDGDFDKINYLASRLEEMTPEQLEKLDAVMHSDFKPESLDRLIDHTYNTDFYSYVPGILSYKELGGYFLNDSGKVQMPEEWKAGIDKEDFGFNAALHEDGKLTDYGYIARSGTDWKEVYAGQETPEKYRIMSYPEAGRTDPAQEEKEANPEAGAAPQDIAAANPSRPIELTAQKPAEKMKEITDRLEQGIQDLFESDRFKEYLQVMSKFHNYSFNNTLLIAMQKPDATLIAGYNSWKNLFGRQVSRGAKGIKVIAPSPYKVKKEVDKIDPKTQKPMTDKNGKPVKEETEVTVPAFKVVSVFDVSQTEGKELPTIGVDELTGDVAQYADFFKATEQASPAPVGFEKIKSGAKGYYSQTEKRIAINEGMSELQNLKTLIHEIAHAKLHDIDLNAPAEEQADRPDRRTREVQAESIAYAVCQHYGLDTSDYSFSYVATWSSGRELSELKASLETIRSTASELIKDIDKNFAELTKDKEQTQAQEAQAEEPTPEQPQPEQDTPQEETTEPTAEPPQEEKAGADEPAADTTKAEKAATEEPAKEDAQTEQTEDNFPTPDPNAEPVVTILWSEHSRFHDGETMSLSEANALIGSLDEATVSEDGYYKTKFRIDFVMDGQPDNYIGRQDLGDGDGTLIDHIESYHAYYENNEQWDNHVLKYGGTEALEADKAQREMLLHEFVPYLKLHNNLSKMEQAATKALEGNSGMTATETAYHTAMKEYVSKCRAMVNSGDYSLPPVPQLKDFDTELEAYKEHVKEEIAQEAAAAGMTVEEYAEGGYEAPQAENTFTIYQLKDDVPVDFHFRPLEEIQGKGLAVDPANYEKTYTAPLTPGTTLEGIFEKFNIDRPEDFKGHSLSVSDVVVLHQNGQDTAHYTDSIGFVEVPEFLREQKQITPDELMTGEQITTPRGSFSVTAMSREQMEAAGYGFHHQSDNGKYLIMGNGTRAFAIAAEQPENHLKAAELSTEQNANMIDGIINNTPAADGLEAAGEQISLEQYAETLKQDETQKNAEPDTACITAASKSRYDGMVALFTLDDKIHIGKSENYDNKGHYDNTDNSLLYVSDCQAAFTFLTSEGCIHPQDEALKQGIYTQEDYKEFARITDFLAQAGFTPEKEFCFDGKPFSLHGDTPEQAAPEAKTIYYTINEGAARRANDANSFYDYKPGSATAEYRQMVDRAVEIGEHQKKRVDPMYHEKIDSLVDTYARKLAENMNSSFSIEARVPSILIAGGSNFPVRKKEKQNAARDRNMEDWNEIQGLLDKIRSTGMGGISADDPQAIQKLEAKLEKLQAAQETMKAVNAYYRKHKTLDGCPALSAERIEAMKEEMSSQWHIQDKPYPSWALSNNNAEIRRIKGRIAELTKKQETAYSGWEFEGGTVEMNREDNRLQIFFEEKPDEKTRETLKESGFRWSPKAGAWQRQLNDNAIYAADRLSCIKPLSGKSPVEIQKEARTAAKTEKKPSIRAQLAQDKEALKNAPKKAAEKTKKQDLERS
ncbi:YodL domain-containing protein [Lachnospiraceae bacterium 62-26]